MDKYTKFILSVIAVGIIGINVQLFKGEIISSAQAGQNVLNSLRKVAICDVTGDRCASIIDGSLRVHD